MPKQVAITRVSKDVLDSIILGSFNRELSTEERALLETVPEGKRPWFERVVVGEYYLALRDVVRSYPVRQNEDPGTQFLQMLITTLALGKVAEEERRDWNRHTSIMDAYYRKTTKPFEDAVEEALKEHREAVLTGIENAVDNKLRFAYLSVYRVTVALRERILG